jgi:hypothetical protein
MEQMSVEKAIELLGQTFIVKDELVMDLIRDALRELGDVDLLITESSHNCNKHIKDLYTNVIDIGDKIFNLEYDIKQIQLRLCKLEGDGR